MVFSSLPFLFGYLPVVLVVLKCAPLHARNFCLFAVSLIFYGWSEPVYILIMLISTLVDYVNGRMVDHYRDDRRKAKRFVWFSVIFNLSLLGFFKYADFFILNLQALGLPLSPLHLSLPVGISFIHSRRCLIRSTSIADSPGSKKRCFFWGLCYAVSAADCRSDCPL
ncbi:MAG: hypothetical protein ACLSA6_10095 [Holdemania massiliensis]